MEIINSDHKESLRFDYMQDDAPEVKDFFMHLHNDYEFLLFISGNADFTIGNKVRNLVKNDLLLIRPAQYHKLCLLSSIPYKRYVFNFKKNNLTENEISVLEDNSVYHVEDNGLIKNMFENLKNARPIYTEEDFENLKRATLHLTIAHLKYLPKSEEFVLTHSVIDQMLSYIDEHLEEQLSSQILAKKFFMSRSSVEHKFMQELKISCKQYINKKKILHAQSMIMDGVPVTKAAELCGYESYSTFYRQYLTVTGSYPLQDRPDILKN